MQKKLMTIFALLVLIGSLSAVFVEVGSGTETTNYIPAYGYYDYGWSRTIYLSSDLLNEMEINTISYLVNNTPSNYTLSNQSFYIKHTTEESIASTEYVDPTTDDDYQLVFNGDLIFNDTGWYDIILDSTFSYNGTDNLEILVLNNDGSYVSGQPIFNGTTVTPERAIYKYSDGTFPAIAGTLSAVYPNTRFHFSAENEPSMPVLVTPTNNGFNLSAPLDLTWTIGENTDWVRVYFSDELTEVATMAEASLLADDYSLQTIFVDELQDLTTYYWRVVAGNNTTELLVSSAIWHFTTSAEEGSIVIGNGQETDTHLPLEPFYGFSITQTIYNQEWINVDDQRIESVSYYYNGNGAWTEDNVQLYLGHTELDEFATVDSWLPLSDFVLVYDGPLAVPQAEGWVTIPLTIPFNYNNEDNLVVGFEANTSGYFGSADEFFGTSTTLANSIYNYNDVTNYDFITPPSGTTQNYIANILLTMGEIPTTPQLMVTPDEYSWTDTIINTSAQEITFSMRNTGLGALTINSIFIDQTVDFILTDNNTYPLDITDDVAQFTVVFHPLSVGDFVANITINDAEVGDTVIQLTGSGYDAMIYDFPHYEDFEGIESGALPMDWSASLLNADSYSAVSVTTWGGYESTNNLRLYNSSSVDADLYAITPPVSNLANRRIRFMAKGSTEGVGLAIGTAENNMGEINFVARDTLSLTTTWTQFVHNFNGVADDINFICLQYIGTGSAYVTVNIDNFYIEQIPTGPAIVVIQDTLNFGDVYLNRQGVGQLNVQNWGILPLEIEFSQTGDELSFTPATATIAAETSQIITVSLDPIAEGDYSGSFEVLSNDTNIPSISVATEAFILPPLPDNISVIGNGEIDNLGLPLEAYWRHSWSQSIYYAGEIGIANQRIEKISWHYNGNSAWGPDDMKIYMGLTSETAFTGNDDWISLESMMEVFNGSISVPAEDGWVEIELNIPFIYDNTQNLVVGVFHTVPSYHTSLDRFYCTPSDFPRSILYYSDSVVPDPSAPPTGNLHNFYPNVTLEFGDIPNAPDLTVYPTNSTFEMVPVDGSSLEKTITMRSIGLQDVTIANAPTISGDDADQFTITTDTNTYPLVLPFNQIATFGVSLTPDSEGSKSATIEIVDDATRETHIINISGYAYADDGNDVPANATSLTLPVDGATYAIMPIGDIDWYKIPAMGIGDTLLASVVDAGGTVVTPSMWLYGPNTNPDDIDPANFLSSGSDMNFVLPQSGDYYLRVARYNVNPAGVNPTHTRKNRNGESSRLLRDDTGLYNLYIDANYNYSFNAPLTLELANQSGFVELTWVEPPYERYLIGYNIYRDGEMLNDVMIPIGTNLYHDAEVIVGTEYNYYVVGMYEDPDGFSLPSNTETIIYYNLGDPLWGDDFEDYPDFALNMENWVQYDVDGGNTYSITDVEFDNAGEPMSYMVFNPASTIPPIEDMIPQSGTKFVTSFASTEGVNDDWMITPRITIGTTTVVSFYAKSYTAEYGLERFRVKMSLGGAEISDFQFYLHQGTAYLEAPTEWTLYHFNVSQLTGNTVRFAVQCVSEDAFVFMLDNFRVDSTDDGVGNADVENIPQVNALSQNYPNPFNPETSISFSMKNASNVLIDVYNIRGQKVKTLLNEFKQAGNHTVVWNGTDENNSSVASGVYFYKMRNGKFSSTKKMILMK